MNRRTQIMQAMGKGGGTEAPNARRAQIKKAVGGSLGKLPPIRYPEPGGTQGRPAPTRGAPLGVPKGPGVTRAAQPQLGRQLSNRVQSGAIGQTQAQKTARQRQTLKKAFGSDWRSKVYAGSGVKEIRQGGPFANRQIAAERAKGLQRAKRKLY